MTNPLVSIIIAPHNGMDYIRECLESVYSQDYRNFEIILVDNASTDGTPKFIEKNFPEVKLIRSSENLAFGPGNNRGASIATGEYLLFLNHDTYVTESFLVELVQAVQSHPEIGVAQSRIMMASDPELVDEDGAYLTWTGMWFHPGRGERASHKPSKPIDVLGAAGACLLVRRVLFDELGGFDPDFRIYFDDIDLSWRARLLGYRAVVVSSSVIHHWGGATTKKLPSSFTVYHSFKNRICSLIKLLPWRDLLLIVPVHLIVCLAASAAYALMLKPANSFAILQALGWNLSNLGRTLAKRSESFGSPSDGTKRSFKDLRKPLPARWFVQTSVGYLSKW